jgi:nitrate reductase gamma subunit
LVGVFIYGLTLGTREIKLFSIAIAMIAVCCAIALTAFIARGIKSLQIHDRATINDYFVDIILLAAYFPIGLWFIQPRLNLLYDQYFRD